MDKKSYNQALEDVRNELITKARTEYTDHFYDVLVVNWNRIRKTLKDLEKADVEQSEEDLD